MWSQASSWAPGRAALVAVLGGWLAAAAPVLAPSVAHAAERRCVQAEEARAAGGDGGTTPTLSPWFSTRTFSLDASADGLSDDGLPISIDAICDVPKRLDKQAAQLAGGDGLALITSATSVWQDGRRLTGAAATSALDGADTARLRVRLAPRLRWGSDEDGAPVPTFAARKIIVTD
jgi:hypothetical protein